MADNRQRIILARPPATRRGLPAAGAAAPVLVGAAASAVRAPLRRERTRALINPVTTELADRTEATRTPGRPGETKRCMYHAGLLRRDLVSFVRCEDGPHLPTGDAGHVTAAVPTAGVTGR
ncbi:hypothetical protein [Streptomyces sp. NPDC048385]|uniref:hypothetical protein n=1 Tax=unclassified Streptomyces TaxID=2593676 RepID=UPI00341D0EF6